MGGRVAVVPNLTRDIYAERTYADVMQRDIEAIQEKIQAESAFVSRLLDEVGRVIVGQRYMVERLLVGLLADGHVLMEGVPGLAKTMTVRTMAHTISTQFRRIQIHTGSAAGRPDRHPRV